MAKKTFQDLVDGARVKGTLVDLKRSRPSLAGERLGVAVIEMVNLMYQNRTALTFLTSLNITLQKEQNKRELEAIHDNARKQG